MQKLQKQSLHFTSPQAAQKWCDKMRKAGKRIGFVATMGALHEGHFSLIQRAKSENDLCIVSIFVNPLQFNKAEDLKNYPRDDAADIKHLSALQVEAVFTGSTKAMLGSAADMPTNKLSKAGIYAQGMEGSFRPGHFEGVREVVSRLFDFVGACRAYFGEKDFQQLQIIRELTTHKSGVTVVGCPTARESNGLAMSSRNRRLSKHGKASASIIYQALQAAKHAWNAGERNGKVLQLTMLDCLKTSHLDLEYAEIRDPNNWTASQNNDDLASARAFIAGNIEGVRLIDNLALS